MRDELRFPFEFEFKMAPTLPLGFRCGKLLSSLVESLSSPSSCPGWKFIRKRKKKCHSDVNLTLKLHFGHTMGMGEIVAGCTRLGSNFLFLNKEKLRAKKEEIQIRNETRALKIRVRSSEREN